MQLWVGCSTSPAAGLKPTDATQRNSNLQLAARALTSRYGTVGPSWSTRTGPPARTRSAFPHSLTYSTLRTGTPAVASYSTNYTSHGGFFISVNLAIFGEFCHSFGNNAGVRRSGSEIFFHLILNLKNVTIIDLKNLQYLQNAACCKSFPLFCD